MASSGLKDKVAIVTGSSSGLGRAISLAYAQEGAILACADLHKSAKTSDFGDISVDTHDVIVQNGGKAIFVQTDVSISEQVKALVAKTVETFGRVDIMVNNAGVSLEDLSKGIHNMDEEVWERMMAVNLRSVFLGCKYSIDQMLKQEPHASGQRGCIVNVSSVVALVGTSIAPAYCATKGAITSLTRHIAIGYAPHKIRCNAICPGLMRTAMIADVMKNFSGVVKEENSTGDSAGAALPSIGESGDPKDVAKSAVFLASDGADWITGVNLPVDGGYTAQ